MDDENLSHRAAGVKQHGCGADELRVSRWSATVSQHGRVLEPGPDPVSTRDRALQHVPGGNAVAVMDLFETDARMCDEHGLHRGGVCHGDFVPGQPTTITSIPGTTVAEQLYTRVESPLGELLLLSDGHALLGLHLQEGRKAVLAKDSWRHSDEPFQDVRAQLEEYFASRRSSFDLRLAPQGTPFQRQVWTALREIPYGETLSYGALARRLGRPAAARAVGLANGSNPISVIIPCHRLVGANGTLVGYGGGIERKQFLLSLEATGAGNSEPLFLAPLGLGAARVEA